MLWLQTTRTIFDCVYSILQRLEAAHFGYEVHLHTASLLCRPRFSSLWLAMTYDVSPVDAPCRDETMKEEGTKKYHNPAQL